MIRPRPTVYKTAIRNDEQFLHVATRYKRPPANCSICGAKLSQYRYPDETRCAPCITRHTATLTAEQLHPIQLAPEPTPIPRPKDRAKCPGCGGWMYRQSMLCRRCFNQGSRAAQDHGDAA